MAAYFGRNHLKRRRCRGAIAHLLLEFEAINVQQDAIEDQEIVDDLLDEIEEGYEVYEARRDLRGDLEWSKVNSSYLKKKYF